MPILQVHDFLKSNSRMIDPTDIFTMLGERAIHASWQIAGVARYDEAPLIVGDQSGDRLEMLSQSQTRVSGLLLNELFQHVAQIIWGEFKAYEAGKDLPWVVLRAIDSSWCEVETEDEGILDRVRNTFSDVREPA